MKGSVNLQAAVVPKTHAPGANAAAIITLAAASGTRHVVDRIGGGYDGDPTGGKLTVASTVNGTAVSQVYHITKGGMFFLPFDPPLQGDDNTAITITLAAGGAGVTGQVNAMTR